MAYLPQVKYPDWTKEFDGKIVSVRWQNEAQGTGRIKFGSVIEIRDFSDYDYTQHTTEQSAYSRDIYEFSNGCKIRLLIWTPQGTGDGYIMVSNLLIDPQGNIIQSTLGWLNSTYQLTLHSADGDFLCNYLALALCGLKLIFLCDYYDYNNPPTDYITEPLSFNIILYAPAYPVAPATKANTLNHINEGELVAINEDENLPYLYDEIQPFTMTFFSSADGIEDFNDFLSNYGEMPPIINGGFDPNQELYPSGPGGGGGSMDDDSDEIDFPTLPTGGALSSCAIKAFLVTTQDVTDLFSKLWDMNFFDISHFQKLVDNPIDCIVSFHAIPVVPSASSTENIKIGSFDTEVDGTVIDSQYMMINCNSLQVKEYWGNALDYAPYTKIDIYLPFVGIKNLNTDDVMNKTVEVKYSVDVLTGDCIAHVKCGKSVLYKFNGNLKQDIPVTARSSDIAMKSIQAGITAIGGIAMGTAIGGPIGAAAMGGAGVSGAISVTSSKVTTSRSGTLAGSVGLLDDFTPYLIIHRPIQSLANKFSSFKGYPSNITAVLSSVSGYTEVEFINLQNIPNATSAEMAEIKNLLKQGVII